MTDPFTGRNASPERSGPCWSARSGRPADELCVRQCGFAPRFPLALVVYAWNRTVCHERIALILRVHEQRVALLNFALRECFSVPE